MQTELSWINWIENKQLKIKSVLILSSLSNLISFILLFYKLLFKITSVYTTFVCSKLFMEIDFADAFVDTFSIHYYYVNLPR